MQYTLIAFACKAHKSNHHKESGFHKANLRLAVTVTPSLLSSPLLFQRRFLQDPGLSNVFFQALHHSLFLSHSAFPWKSLISSVKPASNALVSFNLGGWLGFCTWPSLQGLLSFPCQRGDLMPDVWTVFHWRRGEIHSQVAGEGLQMADRLCAANAASHLELLWGCCQGLVHDIFVI